MRSYQDDDGVFVTTGDHINFSFGIPPKRVDCVLEDKDNDLVAVVLTLGVEPKECKLKTLRRYVGHFWKTPPKKTKYVTEEMIAAWSAESQ